MTPNKANNECFSTFWTELIMKFITRSFQKDITKYRYKDCVFPLPVELMQ